MAFGGVATGSMKANEALSVQGTMMYRGFIPMDWDCTDHRETVNEAVRAHWFWNRMTTTHTAICCCLDLQGNCRLITVCNTAPGENSLLVKASLRSRPCTVLG